jgi:hypothetical protein
MRLLLTALACTTAWAGTASAASPRPSPHPRPRVRHSFLEIAPAAGRPGTVITIHAYCGPNASPSGLAFLVPPTGPATPGQLQPTGEGPATIENSDAGGKALPLAGYPAGTWLAKVTVLPGLPPGVYPVALDCSPGSELTQPFTIPGPAAAGPAFLANSLAAFQFLVRNDFQYVLVYTGPGSTPASYIPNTSPGTQPPTTRVPATTTTQAPTTRPPSTTTTTTCIRTRGRLCP